MGNITALTGLCTSAGVAIAAGTVLAPGDGQKFYAPTGGKKSGKWVIKYDKGDEAALLARPCHVTALTAGSVRSCLIVGQGANAGTMNASPAVVRMAGDTFTADVTDGSELAVENPSGHPLAMLHLDTETVAWASATGTVSLGYEQEADEPVSVENDINVANTVDVLVTNAELDVDVKNASLTIAASTPIPVSGTVSANATIVNTSAIHVTQALKGS